ncbi:MAG: hypothetical protein ACYTFZ_02415 [Planctomycetota bacterium]
MDDKTTAVSKAVWHWRSGADERKPHRPVLPRLLQMLAIMAVFGALAWWRGHRTVAACLGAFALLNALLATLWPSAFRAHAAAWEKLGGFGSIVIGSLVLTLAYYVLFAPAALLLKALGREALKLRFPGPEGTYWGAVDQRGNAEAGYRKQF